jgi:hypothetical protein
MALFSFEKGAFFLEENMKNLKYIFISLFFIGSSTVMADCSKAYKDQLVSGAINASARYAGIVTIPLAIRSTYIAHQSRKMKELISEVKSSRVGKRTKGLHKSLNGMISIKEIQNRVRAGNKWGSFCIKTKDPRSSTGTAVVAYRTFKDGLRLEIDKKLKSKGKSPIWNESDDI